MKQIKLYKGKGAHALKAEKTGAYTGSCLGVLLPPPPPGQVASPSQGYLQPYVAG